MSTFGIGRDGVVGESSQLGVPFCIGGLEIQLGYVVLVSHLGLVVSLTVEVLLVDAVSQVSNFTSGVTGSKYDIGIGVPLLLSGFIHFQEYH